MRSWRIRPYRRIASFRLLPIRAAAAFVSAGLRRGPCWRPSSRRPILSRGGRTRASGISTAASGACHGCGRAGKSHDSVAGRRVAGDRAGIAATPATCSPITRLCWPRSRRSASSCAAAFSAGAARASTISTTQASFRASSARSSVTSRRSWRLPHGGHHRRPGADLFRRRRARRTR